MKIIEELRESKEQLEAIEKLLETSEFLRLFEGGRIGFNGNIPKIILKISHDYLEFIKTIKEVKKISKNLRYNHNFYSCNVMIFTWEDDLIKLWFECYPDEIPSELMPSSDCKVVKTEKTVEENYTIVCEVNNPV